MINVLGLALYGPLAASTRYRLLQYSSGLADRGIILETYSLLSDEYLKYRFKGGRIPFLTMLKSGISRLGQLLDQRKYQCAILYSELFPLLPGIIESSLLRVPYIYDFDDAFYLKYRSGGLGILSPMLGGKFDTVIQRAAAVTAGSRVLAEYAEPLNHNTISLPTVVDTKRYLSKPSSRVNDIFTVGWIGSPSTSTYITQVVETLSLLGKESPVRLIVVGGNSPSIPNVDVVEIQWSEDTEIDHINTFDVGIMPLHDNAWTRGKCALKLIQYMACGVPAIASPVGANRDVLDESSGFFADSKEDWLHAFRFIRDNPKKRAVMGRNARKRITLKYSLDRNLPLMMNIIKSVCKT